MNKPDEDFTITFEERENCLSAFVSGPHDNLVVSKAFWGQVHAKVVELGIPKVLVEEDFPNQVSTMDMFDLGRYISATFGPRIKIAHLDRRLSDVVLNRFGEDVAVNRGLNGRVFNRIEDAEKWLNE